MIDADGQEGLSSIPIRLLMSTTTHVAFSGLLCQTETVFNVFNVKKSTRCVCFLLYCIYIVQGRTNTFKSVNNVDFILLSCAFVGECIADVEIIHETRGRRHITT